MNIDMKTAHKFILFEDMLNDYTELTPENVLDIFNNHLNERYEIEQEDLDLVIQNYEKFEYTKNNVYTIIDFLTFVNYVHLEKVIKHVVEKYVFKQKKFFKELGELGIIYVFLERNCRHYINDNILSFNTAMEMIEFFECEILFNNDLWTLTEIEEDYYRLKFLGKDIKVPPNIKELELGDEFDEVIVLPKGLKKFKVGNSFDQPITFGPHLEEIELGDMFDQAIVLPKGLKTFEAGQAFNQPIVLPKGLKTFEAGYAFNQPIDIPDSLKKFKVGKYFNQDIVIPEFLEEFEMYSVAESTISTSKTLESDNSVVLPKSLKKFKVGEGFFQKVEFQSGIEEIEYNCFYEFKIPDTVKVLKVGNNYARLDLPDSIEEFYVDPVRFAGSFNIPSNLKKITAPISNIPYSLEGVEEIDCYTLPAKLPSTLKKLIFQNSSNTILVLPEGLEELSLAYEFNSPINLPSTLKKFKAGVYFNQPITFGPNLEELELGDGFNKPIVLPKGLKKFKVGDSFDQPITFGPYLEELEFGDMFNRAIKVPPTLKRFKCGRNFYSSITVETEKPEIEDRFNRSIEYMSKIMNHNPTIFMPNLEEIDIGSPFIQPIKLPTTLKYFTIRCPYNVDLPIGVKEVHLLEFFGINISLPKTVKRLEINGVFDQDIDLPEGLTDFVVHDDSTFNKPLVFPSTIKVIGLSNNYDQPIILPEGLTTFYLSSESIFSHPLNFPSSIKTLFLYDYNQPLDFPEGLKHLTAVNINPNFKLPSTLRSFIYTGDLPDDFKIPHSVTNIGIFTSKEMDIIIPSTVHSLTYDGPGRVAIQNGIRSIRLRCDLKSLISVLPSDRNFESEKIYIPPSVRLIFYNSISDQKIVLDPRIKHIKMPLGFKEIVEIPKYTNIHWLYFCC